MHGKLLLYSRAGTDSIMEPIPRSYAADKMVKVHRAARQIRSAVEGGQVSFLC